MLNVEDKDLTLRPETTSGTIWMLNYIFPQMEQRKKQLPICLWQVGQSARNEPSGTLGINKKRLMLFYQLEYQLFCPYNTKTDYLSIAIDSLINNYGGEKEIVTRLPHYSNKTIDWTINGTEVASLSERNDFCDGMLFEVSIGLDRLLMMKVI